MYPFPSSIIIIHVKKVNFTYIFVLQLPHLLYLCWSQMLNFLLLNITYLSLLENRLRKWKIKINCLVINKLLCIILLSHPMIVMVAVASSLSLLAIILSFIYTNINMSIIIFLINFNKTYLII